MSKWHYLSVVALIAILGIIIWQSPSSLLLDNTDNIAAPSKQYPTAYLLTTKTTQYNTQGDISHIITADKMRYFDHPDHPKKDVVVLDNPNITFYNDSSERTSPWKASSVYGEGRQNKDEFLLQGNVVLIQQFSDDKYTTVTSEELLIKPEQQYAETNKPVMIENESGVTTSVGLKISLDQGTIQFLSNVRSQYNAQ